MKSNFINKQIKIISKYLNTKIEYKMRAKNNNYNDYWHELEASERRTKRFNEQFNNPCFGIVLCIVMFICCPCICYDNIRKVKPENE